MAADTESLAGIYRDAARVLGNQVYSDEQTRVWAMHPGDVNAFHESLLHGLTLCAVVDGSPVAFGQLNPMNHVAYLYCHPAHARKGFASAILAKLEERAQTQQIQALRAEVSVVARPFFEQAGFRIVEEEHPVRHGIEFLRFKMEKQLTDRL